MLSVSRLLNGTLSEADALRYGRRSSESPAHLLHFASDKKPVVIWNVTRTCNLHCMHCYSDSHDRDYVGELTTEEGRALLRDLASFAALSRPAAAGVPQGQVWPLRVPRGLRRLPRPRLRRYRRLPGV